MLWHRKGLFVKPNTKRKRIRVKYSTLVVVIINLWLPYINNTIKLTTIFEKFGH